MLTDTEADTDTAAGTDTDTDVVVVGYGPVGGVLAILLAQRGRRVTVLEQRAQPYLLPRATSFDGETARLIAGTGIGPQIGEFTEPADGYRWQNAAGQALLDIDFAAVGPYGWPDANTMHQPTLEARLATRLSALPGVDIRRGERVVGLADDGERVEVTTSGPDGATRSVTARWVVGCDGARSFVREALGVSVTDLGFSYDWLLCDVELAEPRVFTPSNVQICDPKRPTTLVASGPGHRRWEFMRLPGESNAELERPETAWRLLAPFDVTPANATLLRTATYTFQARWADQWRVGRVLLAGDAAHLMPPFAGQGMCSGIRDVANLAWKLDLVLHGLADVSVLDSYTTERRKQVEESIRSSVKLGKVICVSDPGAAADRDAAMLARASSGTSTRPEPAPPLSGGLLYQRFTGVTEPPAGDVAPQGRVRYRGRTGLFDEVVGRGFALFTTEDPLAALGEERLGFLAGLGAHVVRLDPPPVGDGGDTGERSGSGDDGDDGSAAADLDGVYLAYLGRCDGTTLLVRPDYHVFGAAKGAAEAATLVDDLRAQLTGVARAPRSRLGI
ncbi:bifunctional 3-(3-hydroxy-phenyl)propionate/3-hydroxycinnamic acid hydroxylase [Streptomyces tanashiensis]|uniref:Bifunctional 3-(3-hydroxy-phenyl)propionate/3-hydroxycinnamic acid hydroxylase n=1 Tax=Streptomyces tanashiensis TaxID=67367 RepID=A0ABY6QXD4_9ACTN|nr:bifunctional 3-(3-hydroxy-phenyl)propionate/3-hydroxycinnamic acid hydroxylase [Streptomyces tanashiensis]UZX21149.1 bifunctional 3-(3-hydroxy-phenyl)propionate/3-hydroxycinnamic acid hydroxylase [Streptomyces tanashiensis]